MAHMTPTRRKLAIATWSPPAEGNIFGKVTLDVTEALAFLDHLRETTGEKVTITHLVGKAAANALAEAPTLNGKILFGRFYPFETVDIAYLVSLAEGGDLGKVKVDECDEKSVVEIAGELRDGAGKLRKGEDSEFEKSKGLLRILPTWLIRPLLGVTGWLASGLGVNIKSLGVTKYPFGSCIITSVGMLGFDEGYAPFTPFARVPLLLLVGAMRDRPAVDEDGELTVRKMVTITATVDHRFIDGFQLGILAREFRAVIEKPWETLGVEKPAASAEAIAE